MTAVWTRDGETVFLDGEPVCRLCVKPGTDEDPLAQRPGWIEGVLLHEGCAAETRRSGIYGE